MMQVDTSIYPAAQKRDHWKLRKKAFTIAALCVACVLLVLNLLLGGAAWSIIVFSSANVIVTAVHEGLFQKARWRGAWISTVFAVNLLLLCIDWVTGGGWAYCYAVPSTLAVATAVQAALFAADWKNGRADITQTVVLAALSLLHIVLAAPKAALPPVVTQAAMTALLLIVVVLCCKGKLFPEWRKRWQA